MAVPTPETLAGLLDLFLRHLLDAYRKAYELSGQGDHRDADDLTLALGRSATEEDVERLSVLSDLESAVEYARDGLRYASASASRSLPFEPYEEEDEEEEDEDAAMALYDKEKKEALARLEPNKSGAGTAKALVSERSRRPKAPPGAPIHLLWEEILTLDSILENVLISMVDETGPDAKLLRLRVEAIRRQVHRAGRAYLCEHCKEEPRRGKTPYCSRCTSYRRKYGRLPSEETLMRSAARRS